MKLFLGWKLFFISIGLVVPFFAFAITRITRSSQFDDNCTYHIQQALQSDDLDYATNQADIAVEYLKSHGLTNGYTTITSKSSDEDLGLWYKSILKKDQYLHSLKNLSPGVFNDYKEYAAERNLVPANVSVPEGISIYPHNTAYFVWLVVSALLAILGIAGIIVFINEKSI